MANLQLRRGTAAQWAVANPTLLSGEMGVETDTGLFKIGNGVSAWNALPYSSGPPGAISTSMLEGPEGGEGQAGMSPPGFLCTRALWLNAELATLDAGAFANLGASPNLSRYVALADAATQGCFWNFNVPHDWNGGLLVAQPIWVPGATDGVAHTVRWNYVAKNIAAGSDVTAAGTTTPWTGSSAARTVNLIVFDTPTSLGITPVKSGNIVLLEVQRLGADGADTYVGTVNLMGILLTYTAID